MAAAISCIRALPAGRRRMAVIENTPYSTASTPAAPAPQQGGSDLEFVLELAPNRHALDVHVVGQTVAVGRISLPGDQRLEVAATCLGDAEAILADVLAPQLLF